MADRTLTIDVTDAMMERLAETAAASARKQGDVVQEALSEYFDRHDRELALVEHNMQPAAGNKFISNEAMTEWLASWGGDEEAAAPLPDVSRR